MSESHQQSLEVWFMPWADLKNELRIGPVTFWPFKEQAGQKITDAQVHGYLERYFASYVDHRGRPVDTIVVCSQHEAEFRPLSPIGKQELMAAADALVFSCIAPNAVSAVRANNWSMGPPSADRYQLLGQRFRLGSSQLAIGAGSSLSGGWQIGEITFSQPWCMGGHFGMPDAELISGFHCLFAGEHLQSEVERLRRSLEWFRLAHTETQQVSDLSKVVMMATAFEILLNLPRNEKKRTFADRVHCACASSEILQESRTVGAHQQTYSLPAWWARDFYDLRSAIVHGSIPTEDQLRCTPPGRDWLNHLNVADLVWELVKRQLYGLGCIGADLMTCAADLDANAGPDSDQHAEPALVSWLFGFNEVHRALGWEPALETD
jgi:hypothetical protein